MSHVRDPRSKAIIFSRDPQKAARKIIRRFVEHTPNETKFLADCINYQQDLIDQQSKKIEELTSLIGASNNGTLQKKGRKKG